MSGVRTISLETVMSEFDDMVQHELQNTQALANTCREYDTQGDVFNVPFFDQISMQPSDFSAGDIPNTPVKQRNATIVQKEHKLRTTIGNAYMTLFNYDIIQGRVRQHAMAIGRYLDDLKLSAMRAADAEFTAGNNNLVTATSGFKVATLTDAKFKIKANGGSLTDNSMWISAFSGPSFYNDPNFISWDQNPNRPLASGSSIGMYNGIDVRILSEASPDGKLDYNSTSKVSTSYMVNYEALAVAHNRRPKCEVHVEGSQDRVVVLSVATGGSLLMLPKAAVKVAITIS